MSAFLRKIFSSGKEDLVGQQPLKTVSLKGAKFPVRGLIALIGGVFLMGSNSVDFSYGKLVQG